MAIVKLCLTIVVVAFLSKDLYSINQENIWKLFANETYIISNFPEEITGPGLIFEQQLQTKSLRVLYHHKNNTKSRYSIVIKLKNESKKEMKVHIHSGMGGSSKDVIFAGHKAALDFIKQISKHPHTILLKPFSSKIIMKHIIKPQQTSSGIIRVSAENHNFLTMKMGVVDSSFPHLSLFNDIPTLLNQYHVIEADQSIRKISKIFDCKNKIDSIEIGGAPYVKDKNNQFPLYGNYGVIHFVDIFLRNSLSQRKIVKFFLLPKKDNAIDRAVVLLDGTIKEIGVLINKKEFISMQMFHEITLEPNEKRKLSLLTFPQSGCYYPIDIILRTQEAKL